MSDKRFNLESPLYWTFIIGCGALLTIASFQVLCLWFPDFIAWLENQEIKFSERTGLLEIAGWCAAYLIAVWGIYLSDKRTKNMQKTLDHQVTTQLNEQLKTAVELIDRNSAPAKEAGYRILIELSTAKPDQYAEMTCNLICRSFEGRTVTFQDLELLDRSLKCLLSVPRRRFIISQALFPDVTLGRNLRNIIFVQCEFGREFCFSTLKGCSFECCRFPELASDGKKLKSMFVGCTLDQCTFDNKTKLGRHGVLFELNSKVIFNSSRVQKTSLSGYSPVWRNCTVLQCSVDDNQIEDHDSRSSND